MHILDQGFGEIGEESHGCTRPPDRSSVRTGIFGDYYIPSRAICPSRARQQAIVPGSVRIEVSETNSSICAVWRDFAGAGPAAVCLAWRCGRDGDSAAAAESIDCEGGRGSAGEQPGVPFL